MLFRSNTPFGDTNENRILTVDNEIKGIGIAIRAGNSEKENEVILDFIDHYYGHLGINPIKRFSVDVSASNAAVASSARSTEASFRKHLAMEILCFSPPRMLRGFRKCGAGFI